MKLNRSQVAFRELYRRQPCVLSLSDERIAEALVGAEKRKTLVTVNRGVIDRNRKRGENNPPVRAARGKYGKVQYGHVIKLDTVPPVYFVYSAKSPLPHGARVWVETEAKAIVVR